jgi:hypothetical protein
MLLAETLVDRGALRGAFRDGEDVGVLLHILEASERRETTRD